MISERRLEECKGGFPVMVALEVQRGPDSTHIAAYCRSQCSGMKGAIRQCTIRAVVGGCESMVRRDDDLEFNTEVITHHQLHGVGPDLLLSEYF